MSEEKRFPDAGIFTMYRELYRETETSLPYIIGQIGTQNIYLLGVCDVTDPAVWEGRYSDRILEFLITPDEFSGGKESLDGLADRLRDELPSSRYVGAVSLSGKTDSEFQKESENLLLTDVLSDDQAFEKWKDRAFPPPMNLPTTPITVAKRELADLERLSAEDCTGFDRESELRRRRAALGLALRSAETLWVAIDRCSPTGTWPGIDPVRREVRLFSNGVLAERSIAQYREEKIFDFEAKPVSGIELLRIFSLFREMGVDTVRIDEGHLCVTLPTEFLAFSVDTPYVEEQNRVLRRQMLLSVSMSEQLRRHGEELDEGFRRGLQFRLHAEKEDFLRRMGSGYFYVPTALNEELRAQVGSDRAYTREAMDSLCAELSLAGRPRSSIAGVRYTGKLLVVGEEKPGSLPVRLLNDQEEHRWLLAFTGPHLCENFIKVQDKNDAMILFTFKELAVIAQRFDGMVVDVNAVGGRLTLTDIREALRLAKEEDRIQNLKVELVEPERADPHLSASAPENKSAVTQEKPVPKDDRPQGFFRRLFGKRRR